MAAANLNPNDMALLIVVLGHLKSTEVDWKLVATEANLSTPKYARDRWTIVRDKLTGGNASTPQRKGATPYSRKAAGKASISTKTPNGKGNGHSKGDKDHCEDGKDDDEQQAYGSGAKCGRLGKTIAVKMEGDNVNGETINVKKRAFQDSPFPDFAMPPSSASTVVAPNRDIDNGDESHTPTPKPKKRPRKTLLPTSSLTFSPGIVAGVEDDGLDEFV